jgi:hypothetical protein
MSVDEGELIEVLHGDGPDGLTWRVLAGGHQEDFRTYAERRRGSAYARSGFRGPKLPLGELVNTWTGHADGIPPFVMVRAAPDVRGAVAVGATGREYALTFSEVIEPFHLRFGAAPLPEGESVIELRIDSSAP